MAAEMLGVSPSTLRAWEKRYGYPKALRTSGGHRTFELSELEALSAALKEVSDPAAAIDLVRQSVDRVPDVRRLVNEFASFDDGRVNRLLERCLATCSLEQTLEDVLLPSLNALDQSPAEQDFAIRYTTGWLAAQKRLVAPASQEQCVLVVDGSTGLSLNSVNSQALELVVRRAGYRALVLGLGDKAKALVRAANATGPSALVLSGASEDRELFARAVFAVRSVVPEVHVLNYRGALPDTGASTVTQLGATLLEAREKLVGVLAGQSQPVPSVGRVLRSA